MPRFLPISDFRARRRVLVKSDFAVAEGPARRPSDKIDKTTWDHIVTLPDDVAIRTTNHRGKEINKSPICRALAEYQSRSDDFDECLSIDDSSDRTDSFLTTLVVVCLLGSGRFH